ncbi:MAG: hypothetical protein HC788_04945 [Sphingopyxis sp.]|nr:hypothetical protein [Sphingopyxis sp.]
MTPEVEPESGPFPEFDTSFGAEPISTAAIIGRFQSTASDYAAARTLLTERKPVGGTAVRALLAAMVKTDFPADEDAPSWKEAKARLFKQAAKDATGKTQWYVDPSLTDQFRASAITILSLATEALRSGELSAMALYRTGQSIPRDWENLPDVVLAQKVSERAVTYYRGRLFD